MNQVKRRVKIAADNHVTQRYVPPHPAYPVLEDPLANDLGTWVLAPDAFLANHRAETGGFFSVMCHRTATISVFLKSSPLNRRGSRFALASA
jgi:hypothetical protein